VNVETKPRKLHGPWNDGYALHIHTLSSTFLGNDGAGHPRFDTVRSPIGELLYQLKYRGDQTTVVPLVDAIEGFWKMWPHPAVDAIVPVPPSNVRANQPVTLIANALSERLKVPVCKECISKVKRTPQLKDLVEYDKRVEALGGAFSVSPEHTKGKSFLLFDDLYGSGATVSAITELLKGPGGAKAVYLLTLTSKH